MGCTRLIIFQALFLLNCELLVTSGHMHPSPDQLKDNLRAKRENSVDGYESTSNYWRTEAQKKLRKQLDKKLNENVAKNVIFFLGDGMSVSTVTAARIYYGQKLGYSGEESELSFETFPSIGLSKTYCFDKQTADSACSATAYLTGVKANYATLGVNPKVKFNDCLASLDKKNQLSSILQWAQKSGKATGIVTTTRITHASPAGTYSHSANRDWESDADMKEFPEAKNCSDIATQLVREEPGKNFNVIYGGGRKKFISESTIDEELERGDRLDGLDLIDEWLTSKNSPTAHYVYDRQGLRSLNNSKVEHVLGLFESNHMQYHLDAKQEDPTLSEMAKSAIEIMKSSPKGYFLFVEGGRIDHGHHQNLARHALEETVELSEAVRAVVEMTDEKDTLIVVTADHAHTMTLSGYSRRGKDILGLNSQLDDDGSPYATLAYANGPSAKASKTFDENEMSELRFKFFVVLFLSFFFFFKKNRPNSVIQLWFH